VRRVAFTDGKDSTRLYYSTKHSVSRTDASNPVPERSCPARAQRFWTEGTPFITRFVNFEASSASFRCWPEGKNSDRRPLSYLSELRSARSKNSSLGHPRLMKQPCQLIPGVHLNVVSPTILMRSIKSVTTDAERRGLMRQLATRRILLAAVRHMARGS